MKKTFKRIVCLALVVALCASFAGCAKMNYVTNGTIQAIQEVKSGEWKQTDETAEDDLMKDEIVIDELTPGTYAGIEFNNIEDVVNFYVEAYNYTKTLTAEYITEDGSKATYYKLLGTEDLQIKSVLVEGKENATINSLVPGLVGGMFSKSTYGLVPCSNRDPNLDNNSENVANGEIAESYDFRTSGLVADDILACNVTDNGDGTITMVIQPKITSMSMRGADAQGHFFEVLGDIGATVDGISILSWASGTTQENCQVIYKGGTGTIKINVKTKEIVEADYIMNVKVDVRHANVTVLKDKNAAVDIEYSNHYPADDAYTLETKGFKLA